MAQAVPLPALLSQLLVAFTIEFDNEFESPMPHWTTNGGRRAAPLGAPWLVSQVMWANVLQYLGRESIRVGELHARSRTRADSLAGLARWGYVVVTGAQRDDHLVHLTAAGLEAGAIWGPLAAEVEARWALRFGQETIDGLRRALGGVREQFRAELPHYLPIVIPTQNGMARASLVMEPTGTFDPVVTTAPDLSVLLAQVLLQFALDYEADARVSLAIAANTLRVLDEKGVPIRELPKLTGVSKEAHSMALGFFVRRECVVLESDPSARRGKRARLTARGRMAQTEISPLGGRDRRELEAAVRYGQPHTSPTIAPRCQGGPGPTTRVGSLRGPDAFCRWMAALGEATRNIAPLSHGPSSRRLSRWKLTGA